MKPLGPLRNCVNNMDAQINILLMFHSLLYDALKYTYRFHELADGEMKKIPGEIHYPTTVRIRLYSLTRYLDNML